VHLWALGSTSDSIAKGRVVKFTKLAGAKSIDGTEITLRFIDEQNKDSEVTLPIDLALQMVLVVRQVLAALPAQTEGLRGGFVFELVGCQQLAASGGKSGLVLLTKEGFQIPIALDEKTKAGLRRAIDDPPHGIPPPLVQH
jgi:hypothetical protein